MSADRRSPPLPVTAPLFDDSKDPGAMRTIGEVSAALGIRQHVLRYWEEQFASLRPVKRSGGRRYYRTGDVELVMTIDRLVNRDGYTLRGARAVIENSREPSDEAPDAIMTPSPGPGPAMVPHSNVQPDLTQALLEVRAILVKALDAG